MPLPYAVRNVLAHPEIESEVTYAQIKRATEILAELAPLGVRTVTDS